MRTQYTTWIGRAAALLAVIVSVTLGAAAQGLKSGSMPQMPMGHQTMMTAAQKIANAMTAAPASISAKATILDWPTQEGTEPTVLRKGTNGWFCLPDMADTKGNDPVCADGPWMKWVEAYMSKTTPQVGHVGIAYMTAPGGAFGSNTDPYAMTETADNHWALHPPHVMIVVPDVTALEGISTDPANGGPYVMYPGTPYAHIMAPVKLASSSTPGLSATARTPGMNAMGTTKK